MLGCRLVPELRSTSGHVITIEDWTGLRPARDGDVRLEAQRLPPLPPGATDGDGRPLPAAARRPLVRKKRAQQKCRT
jgi:hypothetical protein